MRMLRQSSNWLPVEIEFSYNQISCNNTSLQIPIMKVK
jgi:hypothetical protein